MKAIALTLALLICPVGAWAEQNEVVLQTIAMESGGESLEGQAMVARVIINRSEAHNRPVEAICKAPKQFSCWNSPKWAKAWLARHYTPKARKQAEMALERAITRPIKGITHYHTLDTLPYWAVGHKPICTIGHHVFYEGIA